MNGSSIFVEEVVSTFSSFNDQHVDVVIFPPFVTWKR
ncbi:MAG: triose-phosphate isomerase [Gammaproteobacteria bacterium]|nr:triose-phosphate isomerase [Gammaproteobacteria bacterium]